MSAVTQYLQELNNSCAYARECWPDIGFSIFDEPYSTFAAIIGTCYYFYSRNEKQIAKRSN